jgi:LysM repeat protein
MSLAAVDTLYTVALGDSLSKLAARFYGDPQKYPVIATKNNVNPNTILMVGQRLIIPAVESPVPPSGGSAASQEYVVTDAGVPASNQIIETVTTTASVWYKDWRYWAGIAGVVGVLWYFNSGRRK